MEEIAYTLRLKPAGGLNVLGYMKVFVRMSARANHNESGLT